MAEPAVLRVAALLIDAATDRPESALGSGSAAERSLRDAAVVTWCDGGGRFTVGFSLFAGASAGPASGSQPESPEVPHGHHDPVRRGRPIAPVFTSTERLALAGFLAGYSGLTRQAYELDLRQFVSWCQQHQLDLFSARRADIEFFARDLEAHGRARATITRRLCTVAGFYCYAVEEELLDHSPTAHVRRPRLDYDSHATGLDRNELGALLVAAGLGPPAEHALISLLALLRHAFITAALDAGVPLRDVQEAASHADPRTTMRYDRARTSLDRHAAYIVAAYVAGAAR